MKKNIKILSLKQFIKGEERLTFAFWIYGLLGYFILSILLKLPFELFSDESYNYLILYEICCSTIYLVAWLFLFTGIYRSSKNSDKLPRWLAIFTYSVLGVFVFYIEGGDLLYYGSNYKRITEIHRLKSLESDYYSSGEYEKALETNLSLLKLEPNSSTTLKRIGHALEKLKRYNEALAYFYKALDIEKQFQGFPFSNTSLLYRSIGGIYSDLGEYKNAIDNYEIALNIDLNKNEMCSFSVKRQLEGLGEMWILAGNNEKAIEYYEKALGCDLLESGELHTTENMKILKKLYDEVGDKRQSEKFTPEYLENLKPGLKQ